MQAGQHPFAVGDKAVYPAQGVAEIVSIEEKDIAGGRQAFYVLRLLETDRKILVPVRRAQAVGLRPPVTDEQVRALYALLEQEAPRPAPQAWNRRYRGFMEKLKTGSIFEIAEVLRDLSRLEAEKELSFGERRMLETARSLLVAELAVAQNGGRQQVEATIDRIFGS